MLAPLLTIIGGVGPYFFSSNWWVILAFRSLLGISAGMYGIRNPLLAKSVPEEKLSAFTGYGMAIMSGSGALLGILVGMLAETGWKNAFLINLFPIISLTIILLFLQEPPKDEAAAAELSHTEKTNEKLPAKVFVYALFQYLMTTALYPLLSEMSIYVDSYKLGSATLAATLVAVYNFAGIAGNMALGTINKIFKKLTLPVASLLVVLGLGFVLFTHSLVATFVSVVICGIGFMTMFGMFQVYNAKVAPPSKIALGSTIIFAANQLARFSSSYFIDLFTKIVPEEKQTI